MYKPSCKCQQGAELSQLVTFYMMDGDNGARVDDDYAVLIEGKQKEDRGKRGE